MRKALVIGIDEYPAYPLNGCVNDAIEMKTVLSRHADGSPNFSVKSLVSNEIAITKSILKGEIDNLFSGDPDIALLFFAGHGFINSYGGYVMTPDFKKYDEGVSMDDVLGAANRSKAKNRVIIFDCCHSGVMGSPQITEGKLAELANGITVLTACRQDEIALEKSQRGLFTTLLIDALQGCSADLLGNISPGSIYAYVDRSLGPWAQRPVFKTNISGFVSLRNVEPPIQTSVLRNIVNYFKTSSDEFNLDPTFEDTIPGFNPQNVAVMKELQSMNQVGLVKPVGEKFMYFAAVNSKSCKLSALGIQYWNLVSEGNI